VDARRLATPTDDGVTLSGEESLAGEALGESAVPAIVLLHGLTATRRYVVMGSRLLERSGARVIAYDARGHGRSSPAPTSDGYGYARLAADLGAVLDASRLSRAAIVGTSMGAQTAIHFALRHPERVAALGLITPAFDPEPPPDPAALARWDTLSRGLREGGVEGFLDAYDLSAVPDAWRATLRTGMRQRLSAHEHPAAVADALRAVPRSRPFERFADLGSIEAPVTVIASRDDLDPGHPLAVAQRYAAAIPAARLVVEDAPPPIRSPIAWQGGQLSKVLLELLARASNR
jgi:3-oxoadipate enol-lactonase